MVKGGRTRSLYLVQGTLCLSTFCRGSLRCLEEPRRSHFAENQKQRERQNSSAISEVGVYLSQPHLLLRQERMGSRNSPVFGTVDCASHFPTPGVAMSSESRSRRYLRVRQPLFDIDQEWNEPNCTELNGGIKRRGKNVGTQEPKETRRLSRVETEEDIRISA